MKNCQLRMILDVIKKKNEAQQAYILYRISELSDRRSIRERLLFALFRAPLEAATSETVPKRASLHMLHLTYMNERLCEAQTKTSQGKLWVKFVQGKL